MVKYKTDIGKPTHILRSDGSELGHGSKCEYRFYNDEWVSPTLTLMAPSAVPSVPISQRQKQALVLCVGTDRNGWVEEQASASSFFRALGFQVQVIRDPAGKAMVQQVRNFTQLQQGTEMAIAVMAHGRGGFIKGRDGEKVHLDELFGLIDSENAPQLISTRKFLFVQACRKEERRVTKNATSNLFSCASSSVESDDDDDDGCLDHLDEGHPRNFYLTYATLPGEVAKRGVMFKHLFAAQKQSPASPIETLVRVARGTVQSQYQQLMETKDFLEG